VPFLITYTELEAVTPNPMKNIEQLRDRQRVIETPLWFYGLFGFCTAMSSYA
jgi:hypothetical protein